MASGLSTGRRLLTIILLITKDLFETFARLRPNCELVVPFALHHERFTFLSLRFLTFGVVTT
jgi:hypothetical protein